MCLHMKLIDAVLVLVALHGQTTSRAIDDQLSTLDLGGDVPVYPNRVHVAIYQLVQRQALTRTRRVLALGPQAPRWATMLAEACVESPALAPAVAGGAAER